MPGATWVGLDPRNLQNNLDVVQASVGNIPFEAESMDWVLAFSTIEHWHEANDSIEKGLSEIYRVLTPGGKLLITLPLFIHGADDFLLGRVDRIMPKFFALPWQSVYTEAWRREHSPLEPEYPYLRFREFKGSRHKRRRHQYMLEKRIEKKWETLPSCWIMEVLAEK